MASLLRRAKNYKVVPYNIIGKEAHVVDPYTPPPRILKPPAPRAETAKCAHTGSDSLRRGKIPTS